MIGRPHRRYDAVMKNETLTEGLKAYTDRMKQIRILSSPGIDGLQDQDAYSRVLRENFRNIGRLAAENRDFISNILEPVLESRELLDEETVEAMQTAGEELLDASEAESIDLPIASLIVDRLFDDSVRKDILDYKIAMLDKQIETNYLLVNMTKRITSDKTMVESFREKGLVAFKSLLQFLDKDTFSSLSPESRETVLIDSRYGVSLYETMGNDYDPHILVQIQALESSLNLSDDPFYHDSAKEYDWKYHIFRIYDYLRLTNPSHQSPEICGKIVAYTEKCMEIWSTDPDYYSEFAEYVEIEGTRLKNNYLAGNISRTEYRDEIYKLFLNRDPYDYSTAGYDTNIEYPADYILYSDDADIDKEEASRIDDIYRNAIAFIFRMPKMGILSTTLEPYARLLYEFKELEGCITFEEMGIRSLAALHPPTYIHSRMVARISSCLARHLMDIHPELFYGICGYEEGCDIRDYSVAITEYTYHSALCHDFGKLMIIDTIFVYGRKLLDFEFNLIKSHPMTGAELLSGHNSTAAYADVAKGHHLWYDCSRGYPYDFNTFDSPVKTIIDIVAVADCMDAATDSVGRSYNKGKTLEEYTEEVASDAGTRYAPWSPELLSDSTVHADLEDILENGRMSIYRETYHLLKNVNNNTESKGKGNAD